MKCRTWEALLTWVYIVNVEVAWGRITLNKLLVIAEMLFCMLKYDLSIKKIGKHRVTISCSHEFQTEKNGEFSQDNCQCISGLGRNYSK